MIGTTTFKAFDYQLTVKNEFLVVAKDAGVNLVDINLEDTSNPEIIFKLLSNLHNESGPALVHVPTGAELFVINGNTVNEEQARKMKNDFEYNKRLLTILEEKE